MSALDASIASRLKRDANGLFVAVAQERATPGLLFYDLKRCLARVADDA